MVECRACGKRFCNTRQLGPHVRFCIAITQDSDNDETDLSGDDVIEAPVIYAPITAPEGETVDPLQITRRSPELGREEDLEIVQAPMDAGIKCAARDFLELQDMWREYVQSVLSCCSLSFWNLFETVQHETTACRDRVLTVVKKTFRPEMTNSGGRRKQKWPKTTRSLTSLVDRNVGIFWDNVTETHTVDISQFNIPGCAKVTFEFVDPLYVWIERANAVDCPLRWEPKSLKNPTTGVEIYGAGIEYGLLMRNATAGIPAGGQPALMNLSWDGGLVGFGSRSVSPLCVQVMNADTASRTAVGLVAYLPSIECSDALKGTTQYREASRYLLQVYAYMLQTPRIRTSPTPRIRTSHAPRICYTLHVYAQVIPHLYAQVMPHVYTQGTHHAYAPNSTYMHKPCPTYTHQSCPTYMLYTPRIHTSHTPCIRTSYAPRIHAGYAPRICSKLDVYAQAMPHVYAPNSTYESCPRICSETPRIRT